MTDTREKRPPAVGKTPGAPKPAAIKKRSGYKKRSAVKKPPESKPPVDAAAPADPVCAICGKPITSGCTIDHVVPQAIYKWHEEYLDRAEFSDLRRRITSPRNTVKTHRRCNERKEETIVRPDGLHVSRTKRAKLRATYTAVEPYIEAFLARKAELSERQQGLCFICRAPLKGGVLRRIDDTLERTWDNACLICHRCNCKVKSKDVKTYKQHRKAAAIARRRAAREQR